MKFVSAKLRYVLTIAMLIVLAGLVLAWGYLNSAAFRNLVLEKVNTVMDGRLSIAGHRIFPFSGRVALTGIRLESVDGRPLLDVARLEIDVVLPELLRHKIRIASLLLDQARVVLAFDGQDEFQWIGVTSDRPVESDETGQPWQVSVDDYRIKGGEFVFQRPAKKWLGKVSKIEINGELSTGGRQARLNLSAGPLVWQAGDDARTFPGLKASVHYMGDKPSTIALESGHSRLSAKGRLIPQGDRMLLDVAADLDLALDDARAWISADIPMTGQLAARIAAQGALDDPRVSLQLDLPQGALAGVAVAPLKGDLLYHHGNVTLSTLAAQGDWGNLQATGSLDLAGETIVSSDINLISADLAALGSALGVALPLGAASVKLSAQGPWTHPVVRAEVLAERLKWRQYAIGRLLAAADMNESGLVTVSRLFLENQGSQVQGRGKLFLRQNNGRWLADPGLDLSLQIVNLEPSDFGLELPVRVRVNAALDVGGTVQHIKGKAVLRKSTIHWNDLLIGVQGKALWDDGLLTVPELTATHEKAALAMQGIMRLRHPSTGQWLDMPMIEADVRSKGFLLHDFLTDCDGAVALEAQIKGTPADINGTFHVTGNALVLAGQPLDTAGISGTITGNRVTLNDIDIALAPGQSLKGQGWYGFDRRFELALNAESIDVRHFPALQRAYPVEGLLKLTLQARGSIENPVVTTEMAVLRPRLNHQLWDDFFVTARLEDQSFDLSADLNFKVKAHGRMDSGDFDLTASLDDADLSPYLAMAGGAQWGGKVSGRIDIGGNWRLAGQIRADLDIADALVRYQKLDFFHVRQLSAQLHNGLLALPSTRLDLMDKGFVNLAASGDLSRDMLLTADGRLPLAALAPFSDILADARGDLAFQVRVAGSADGLQWQGQVDLQDIAMAIPGLDQQVQALSGRILISPRELTLTQVGGRMDNGRFTLSGRVDLADLKPSCGQLILNAQSLPLQWPDTMDVVVNADLTYEGDSSQSVLSGKVTLLEGTYYKDVRLNLLSAVGQPHRAEPVRATGNLPPWLAATGLNVALTHRYPLLVDNNMAQLQVAPDLKLTGTLGRPLLSGRAQITEGEVIFRRKTFTVKRGVVDFINPYKIEPTLDIAAEAQIRQWLVSLNLTGTPDRLVFKLNSDPAESESDILSLILLGRTGAELAGGQGGGGQTTRQMLAALVATAWGEDVKKTAGLDILELETGADDSEDDNTDTIQVTVGKRLSRRLTVKYEVESGREEMVQRAVSEYRFLDHLLASGFQDSVGGYGGELLFRIEF